MKKLLIATALFAASSLQNAFAFPIADTGDGLKVIVGETGSVVATYLGNSADYSNDLYLMLDDFGNPGDDGDLSNDMFIFNNHTSPVNSTVDLGIFNAGAELIFRLFVNDTGFNYFTGPEDRNPDNRFHARVEQDWQPDETLVSFEDLYGGPFDFNDLSFAFTNTRTEVPAPATLALVGLGLLGFAGARRRK
ncbi:MULTISPECIES: PEP-CTERM sorting domain-containing protein [Corallincola]|uniref:PEP-CTERM sorting domain-containing protein n=3 Tax=Corallincola TaxID=1775176 RepID=A0A368NKX3_9GAMM|nr:MULTISPECIES: PEP-CTERM sorting domain-containing protein [Corallincola]RCU51088.1 PEP-CTERM sorting domain-containing protein [Corallincola holothuriorum]TAA46019.1 PEP-CTERM sorting domain-containing protein [Corallincola spongiicola]TCI04129.1 PEP-CTERM sorting domain-containing protein [Corallincola luteus]